MGPENRHRHASGEHAHGHDHSRGRSDERAVGIAALVTGSFMLTEVSGGLISGSLGLEAARLAIKSRLSSRFGMDHATVEVQEAGATTEPYGAAAEVSS